MERKIGSSGMTSHQERLSEETGGLVTVINGDYARAPANERAGHSPAFIRAAKDFGDEFGGIMHHSRILLPRRAEV